MGVWFYQEKYEVVKSEDKLRSGKNCTPDYEIYFLERFWSQKVGTVQREGDKSPNHEVRESTEAWWVVQWEVQHRQTGETDSGGEAAVAQTGMTGPQSQR